LIKIEKNPPGVGLQVWRLSSTRGRRAAAAAAYPKTDRGRRRRSRPPSEKGGRRFSSESDVAAGVLTSNRRRFQSESLGPESREARDQPRLWEPCKDLCNWEQQQKNNDDNEFRSTQETRWISRLPLPLFFSGQGGSRKIL